MIKYLLKQALNGENQAVVCVKLPTEALDELFKRFEETEGYQLEIDLQEMKVKDNNGLEYSFDLDDFNRTKLLKAYFSAYIDIVIIF